MHAVLEKLYDLPAARAHRAAAQELIGEAWAELRQEPGVAELFGRGRGARPGIAGGLAGLGRPARRELLRPRGPDPHPAHGREQLVEVTCPTACCCAASSTGSTSPRTAPPGRRLQDRRHAAGGLRGQGAVPDEVLRAGAVAHPRRRGRQLKLMYLGDSDTLTYAPKEGELVRFERTLRPSGRRSNGRRHRRLPAQQEPAVRLVRPPGAVPLVRGHFPRRSRRGRRGRRLRTLRSSNATEERLAGTNRCAAPWICRLSVRGTVAAASRRCDARVLVDASLRTERRSRCATGASVLIETRGCIVGPNPGPVVAEGTVLVTEIRRARTLDAGAGGC